MNKMQEQAKEIGRLYDLQPTVVEHIYRAIDKWYAQGRYDVICEDIDKLNEQSRMEAAIAGMPQETTEDKS